MRRGRETRQRAGSAKDGGRDAAAAAGGNDDQGGELAAAASPSRQGFAFLHPEEDGGTVLGLVLVHPVQLQHLHQVRYSLWP